MIEEEDAVMNWCPMMASNRGDYPQRCCASDCMAWRWSTADENETKGFCGLAGIPYAPIHARNR